ncbi:MAG TPA: hypothetical protein VGB85_10625 [Nannocystis sp.]|jgi:hypothetical protein
MSRCLAFVPVALVLACATASPPPTPPEPQPVAERPPPSEPASPPAGPGPVWPADATGLEVSDLGGGYGGLGRCHPNVARLDVATKQVSWEACDVVGFKGAQRATGARTLSDAEFAEVNAALQAVSRVEEPRCGVPDADRVHLRITTAAGVRTHASSLPDSCPVEGIDSYVGDLAPIVKMLHRLGHHAQVEADCAAGKAESCTVAASHRLHLFSDIEGALAALDRGCKAGDLAACAQHATHDSGGAPVERLKAIERACDAKIAGACVTLADAYTEGKYGAKKNGARAKSARARACAAGSQEECSAKP